MAPIFVSKQMPLFLKVKLLYVHTVRRGKTGHFVQSKSPTASFARIRCAHRYDSPKKTTHSRWR